MAASQTMEVVHGICVLIKKAVTSDIRDQRFESQMYTVEMRVGNAPLLRKNSC